jgi:hypothetical protein
MTLGPLQLLFVDRLLAVNNALLITLACHKQMRTAALGAEQSKGLPCIRRAACMNRWLRRWRLASAWRTAPMPISRQAQL